MPNLKLDIIYYKTASDFELEFNLSGCCRMRIFKDKVDSQKDLITTLARDVSRSSIILIVTDLFGENSGVETVTKAVGLNLTVPNKIEYGIKTADHIKIPNGAVPLVTKSGIYGGCIIESGPQSIIIVSNVRALRHEIMKAYIHNYVFDVAQLAAYNERINQSGQVFMPQRITEIDEQPVSVGQDEASSSKEETQVITEEVTETNPTEEMGETEDTVSQEPQREDINDVINKTEELLTPEEAFQLGNNDNSDEIETVYSNRKPRRKASNIALLVIVILLLIGFGVLAYFFVYMPLTGQDGNFFVKDNFITDFIKEWFMN